VAGFDAGVAGCGYGDGGVRAGDSGGGGMEDLQDEGIDGLIVRFIWLINNISTWLLRGVL
jgi:hypothetical protein